MHNLILCIDFDGTIAELEYPRLGAPKANVTKVLADLYDEGAYIIIWTCREGSHIEDIKKWCFDYGVPYHQINQHHPDILNHYGNDTRKVAADIYIDDKCLNGLPNDWLDIYQLIKLKASELHSKLLDIMTPQTIQVKKGSKLVLIEQFENDYPIIAQNFKRLQQEDYALCAAKMLSYGMSNISVGTELANDDEVKLSLTGIWFRSMDKIQRLKQLIVFGKTNPLDNEPAEDAYADLSNYSIIARLVKGGFWKK
jgi:hypothetical protein